MTLLPFAVILLEINLVGTSVIHRETNFPDLLDSQVDSLPVSNPSHEITHVRLAVTDSTGEERVFLSPQKAKTLLRRKRRYQSLIYFVVRVNEMREEDEESEESRRREEKARFCRITCWGEWQAWSACSSPCGMSASRTRGRQRSPPQQCVSWVNSHGCNGASTQSAPCNRACHNGGTLRSTDCACPPTHRGRCCEHRVTCAFPGKPTHGAVSPAGWPHGYGARVQFSCNTGYSLNGSTSRTCQSNGSWSGSVPTCNIIDCGDPGSPLHSRRNGDSFVFNAKVVYSCEMGFMLVGSGTRVCQANGRWSPSAPTCPAVDCGAPDTLGNGTMILTGTVFRNAATFSCNEGFFLEGSSRRECQANAQWNGAPVSCIPITCAVLSAPIHGALQPMTPGVMAYGSTVEFSCNEGYTLYGSPSRTCSGSFPQGFWTGSQPSCKPVNCGNPGTPDHGAKDGGLYIFLSTVAFSCHPGYKIDGASVTQCQANGSWTNQIPHCEACPVNSFKPGLNKVEECIPCPRNSHTLSVASENIQGCVCDEGFRGEAGICLEILCPPLSEPVHGRIIMCGNNIGGSCNMTCVDGHIRVSGDASRACHDDGDWSGQDLVCQACPQSTYKDGEDDCVSCPENSKTSGTGHTITGCVCDQGFSGPPGGPCADLDECISVANCSQACVNTHGSFSCECDQPGYILAEEDQTTCLTNNQCPPLEAPSDGGLVCLQSKATNTRRCSVKCNPGFEHILRVNEFEECGPATNWRWSNEIDDRPILPCVEQHFPGVEISMEAAYLVEDCEAITDGQKTEIAQQFVSVLEDFHVCVDFGEPVCNIEDVTIKCGMVTENDYLIGNYDDDFENRYKRSIQDSEALNKLTVKFNITVSAKEQHSVNCLEIFPESQIQLPRCQDMCQLHHRKTSSKVLARATHKLQRLFGTGIAVDSGPSPPRYQPLATTQPTLNIQGPRLSFGRGRTSILQSKLTPTLTTAVVPSDARRETTTPPASSYTRYFNRFVQELSTISLEGLTMRPLVGLKKSAVQRVCATGMVLDDNMCVPCPPGSFLHRGENLCILCPRGTYQPDQQQTECLPCNQHTSRGAMHCPPQFELEYKIRIRQGSN